jgi:hypothetical protein
MEDPIAQLEAERQLMKLTSKKTDLENQERDLNELIAKYEQKIDVLSDTAAARRKKMQEEFRNVNAKKFSDIDIKKALVFGNARHAVPIGGMAKFVITVPTGSVVHAMQDFARGPKIVKDPSGKEIDLSPLSDVEETLLVYLVGAQMIGENGANAGPEQNMETMPPTMKLQAIRALPLSTAAAVANEANLLQAYLNAVLELEMGN